VMKIPLAQMVSLPKAMLFLTPRAH
jgi:hypothetical protein